MGSPSWSFLKTTVLSPSYIRAPLNPGLLTDEGCHNLLHVLQEASKVLGEGQMWGGHLGHHSCSFSSSGLGVAVICQDVGQAQDTIHLQMETGTVLVDLEKDGATVYDSNEAEPTPLILRDHLSLLRTVHTPCGARKSRSMNDLQLGI